MLHTRILIYMWFTGPYIQPFNTLHSINVSISPECCIWLLHSIHTAPGPGGACWNFWNKKSKSSYISTPKIIPGNKSQTENLFWDDWQLLSSEVVKRGILSYKKITSLNTEMNRSHNVSHCILMLWHRQNKTCNKVRYFYCQ